MNKPMTNPIKNDPVTDNHANILQRFNSLTIDDFKRALNQAPTDAEITTEMLDKLRALTGPIENLLTLQHDLEELNTVTSHVGALNNLTPQQLSDAHKKAKAYFEAGNIKQANKLFMALTVLVPTDKRVWFGLGACQEQQKHYQSAIESYQQADLQATDDPRPKLRQAHCYWQLGKLQSAHEQLSKAFELMNDKNDSELATEAKQLAHKLNQCGMNKTTSH